MDVDLLERIENKSINIYNKFDILDEKLNNFHIKFDETNKMIDIINSDEYSKIYKTYYPIKNYDLVQDEFFYICWIYWYSIKEKYLYYFWIYFWIWIS